MAKKTEVKKALKKSKALVKKEISSLKKDLNDYKKERQADWKSFKNKINDDINKLKKRSK